MQPLRIVSTGLALLSLLLLLLALGSNYWLVYSKDNHEGLWKTCSSFMCSEHITVREFYDTTRAFLCLGMIAGGLSSLALLTSFLSSHLGPVPLTLVSTVGSFSAGLCAMIAMAVFTAEIARFRTPDPGQPPIFSYGWSFGLGWASFPLFLLTGALTICIPKPASS